MKRPRSLLDFGVAATLAVVPILVAVLVAVGNAICGNSAIAAVAPAIGADKKDISVSIAFTAVVGVGLILGCLSLYRCWR